MVLSQIEAFVEVARRGSLRRASKTLFVTQPALTARLQRLEQEVGQPLFVRSRTGMRLTEIGRAFLPYAERALETLTEGKRLIVEMARGGAGELTVGASPAVAACALPLVLTRFVSTYPNVRLTVRTEPSAEVLAMILGDRAQIGLVRALTHSQVESIPFYEDEVVLVSNPHSPYHPSAVRGRFHLQSSDQLILFNRSLSYHEFGSMLEGAKSRGSVDIEDIGAIKEMVQAGLGVGLVPYTAVAAELAEGSLRAVTLADVESTRYEIVAIRRNDIGPPPGAVTAFLATLHEVAQLLSMRIESWRTARAGSKPVLRAEIGQDDLLHWSNRSG